MNFSYRDLALALISAFLGSIKGYFVSNVNSIGALEIFFLRSIGATALMLPIVIYHGYKMWYAKEVNLLLLVRSVIGNIAVCGYYYGFVYLPIAEASLLFYSTPIFTIIIGRVFLRENCGFVEVISTALSVGGVCAICVPELSNTFSLYSILGVTGSLIGALAQAIALVLIRKITQIPPFVVSFWWATVGAFFSSSLSMAFDKMKSWKCGWESVYLISIAGIGFISEVSLVSALKSTDAVIVSLALTSEIIWSFILQYFLSKDIPSFMTVIGGAMIGVSLLLPPTVKIATLRFGKTDLKCSSQKAPGKDYVTF